MGCSFNNLRGGTTRTLGHYQERISHLQGFGHHIAVAKIGRSPQNLGLKLGFSDTFPTLLYKNTPRFHGGPSPRRLLLLSRAQSCKSLPDFFCGGLLCSRNDGSSGSHGADWRAAAGERLTRAADVAATVPFCAMLCHGVSTCFNSISIRKNSGSIDVKLWYLKGFDIFDPHHILAPCIVVIYHISNCCNSGQVLESV